MLVIFEQQLVYYNKYVKYVVLFLLYLFSYAPCLIYFYYLSLNDLCLLPSAQEENRVYFLCVVGFLILSLKGKVVRFNFLKCYINEILSANTTLALLNADNEIIR